ncbi:hypothetical protein RF55_12625 [Lasius niger]|uniref:CCHC-type domain-containing protein n=1 Tax=Lasius niger TaxID=67767 RepID=A0A0J7N5J2_LASNI|nr:hypothetical protein RF55_12625 [Lasius niger]
MQAVSLQAALREIRELREEQMPKDAEFEERLREKDDALREEQMRKDAEFEERLRERDDALRQLEERISLQTPRQQLSPSNNREQNLENNCRNDLGYKLKPDSYDGSVPLREFLTQFNLIARANRWSDSSKTVALAACLRGKARSVLDGIFEIENLSFEEIKSKLELRFGEGHLAQTYYTQFTNRKQKFSEDIVTLGSDIERLSRLAYPECTHEVRDKIACTQFVAALSNGFIKQTLQLENVSSLKPAIERAMAIKVIQENSFTKNENMKFNREKRNFVRNSEKSNDKKEVEKKNIEKRRRPFKKNFNGNNKQNNNNFKQQKKECWKCGALGHFRSECPSEISEAKENSV